MNIIDKLKKIKEGPSWYYSCREFRKITGVNIRKNKKILKMGFIKMKKNKYYNQYGGKSKIIKVDKGILYDKLNDFKM